MSGFRYCVYGAQFGSEGKGCAAEWLISTYRTTPNLVVLGENAPNSGHNNSRGKTRSLPVSAYYATHVILGPDSAIDPQMLAAEVVAIKLHNPSLQVFVHENAAMINGATDCEAEANLSLATRIGSTQSGGGYARTQKALLRERALTMQHWPQGSSLFEVVDRVRYHELLVGLEDSDWIIECSQGLMLDMNLGYYPYVTSRSTHPRVVIERNGWGPSGRWSLVGVYRTYPIRTGGNSGPTGGRELTWESLGLRPEIAAVTKRVRRVFEFSGADFIYSLNMVKPHVLMWTHVDYLPEIYREWPGFEKWLVRVIFGGNSLNDYPPVRDLIFLGSTAPSLFKFWGKPSLGNLQSRDGQALTLPRMIG